MRIGPQVALATALTSLAGTAATQSIPPIDFAPPVRLQAGEKLLGNGRLFPSPVFHDVDGDGRADIVVGDLPGKLTVALRLPGDSLAYGAEKALQDSDGKPIDFGNW